jgi:hypothetical protein
MVRIGEIQTNKGTDITAASNIVIGDGNYFIVNGTTAIDTITAGPVGKVATLEFANDQAKVRAGTIRLAGQQDFFAMGTGQKSTLTLLSDGTEWIEVARSPQSVRSRTTQVSRDLSAGTGNQSFTGFGFKPKTVFMFSAKNTQEVSINVYGGEAIGGSGIAGGAYIFNASGAWSMTNGRIVAVTDATDDHSANPVSFDDDGFTINWTTAVGTGTTFMRIIAFI